MDARNRSFLVRALLTVMVQGTLFAMSLSSNGSANGGERQRHARNAVFVHAKLTCGEHTTDATILNLSMTGAKIRSHCPVNPGDIVDIFVREGMRLVGEVIWESRNDFGICFVGDAKATQEVVVRIILEDAPDRENRRHSRRSVFFSGMLLLDQGTYKCRVRNISLGGVLISLTQPVVAPKKMRLSINRFGDFWVNTIWQSGLDIGLSFVEQPDQISERFGDLFQAPIPILGQETIPEESNIDTNPAP